MNRQVPVTGQTQPLGLLPADIIAIWKPSSVAADDHTEAPFAVKQIVLEVSPSAAANLLDVAGLAIDEGVVGLQVRGFRFLRLIIRLQ